MKRFFAAAVVCLTLPTQAQVTSSTVGAAGVATTPPAGSTGIAGRSATGTLNTTGSPLNTAGSAINTTGSPVNTTGAAINTTGNALNTTGTGLPSGANTPASPTSQVNTPQTPEALPNPIGQTFSRPGPTFSRPALTSPTLTPGAINPGTGTVPGTNRNRSLNATGLGGATPNGILTPSGNVDQFGNALPASPTGIPGSIVGTQVDPASVIPRATIPSAGAQIPSAGAQQNATVNFPPGTTVRGNGFGVPETVQSPGLIPTTPENTIGAPAGTETGRAGSLTAPNAIRPPTTQPVAPLPPRNPSARIEIPRP